MRLIFANLLVVLVVAAGCSGPITRGDFTYDCGQWALLDGAWCEAELAEGVVLLWWEEAEYTPTIEYGFNHQLDRLIPRNGGSVSAVGSGDGFIVAAVANNGDGTSWYVAYLGEPGTRPRVVGPLNDVRLDTELGGAALPVMSGTR